MQMSITAGNSSKRDVKEEIGKYQKSGNNRRVTRNRLGSSSNSNQTEIWRHDWGTRVHDNWQDERINNTDQE